MRSERKSKIFLILFSLLMLAPLWCLLFLSGSEFNVESSILNEAYGNTAILALSVVALSSIIGYTFSFLYFFFDFLGRRWLRGLLMLPLALPAYVLAFIYLGLSYESDLFSMIPMQGEIWFLTLVLSFSLAPYIFFFANIGFRSITRSEWETHLLLSDSFWAFFSNHVFRKTFPFLLSAQILVLFECLSDFGAASMVNVPVVTTMIYKLWFDLFSFEGAVLLSLRYSGLILLVLFAEWMIRRREVTGQPRQRDPFVPLKLGFMGQFSILFLFSLFLGLSFGIPFLKIIDWSFFSGAESQMSETWSSLLKSFWLALGAGFTVVIVSLLLQWRLFSNRSDSRIWNLISSIGYSLPGSILAVATYALLVYLKPNMASEIVILCLIVALAYKFLTVGMRPLGDKFKQLPAELLDATELMNPSIIKQWREFYWPYLQSSSFVVFFLVVIEVIKEMPLTLMLAPGGYQTLSIKIFNYTSEGEWEKAALPSLMLLIFGLIAVLFLEKSEESL